MIRLKISKKEKGEQQNINHIPAGCVDTQLSHSMLEAEEGESRTTWTEEQNPASKRRNKIKERKKQNKRKKIMFPITLHKSYI